LYIQNIGKIITVCKKIVRVNGPWFNIAKKLGTTSVIGENIYISFKLKWRETLSIIVKLLLLVYSAYQ